MWPQFGGVTLLESGDWTDGFNGGGEVLQATGYGDAGNKDDWFDAFRCASRPGRAPRRGAQLALVSGAVWLPSEARVGWLSGHSFVP